MSHVGDSEVFGLADPVREVAEDIWLGEQELFAEILEIRGRALLLSPTGTWVMASHRLPQWPQDGGLGLQGPSCSCWGPANRRPWEDAPIAPHLQEEETNLPRKPRTSEQSTMTPAGLSLPQVDGGRLSHPDLLRSQSLLPDTHSWDRVISRDPGWSFACSGRARPRGRPLSPAPPVSGTRWLDLRQRISWWKRW